MKIKEFYDTGLLERFLYTKNQPEIVKKFLEFENNTLLETISPKVTLIDLGCGNGRHLELLKGRIKAAFGVDYSPRMIEQAKQRLSNNPNIKLIIGDICDLNLKEKFDYVICMNNTLGNIEDVKGTIFAMKRLFNGKGKIIVGVSSPESITARLKWYKNVGLKVERITSEKITASKGYVSFHFTKEKIKSLFGNCEIKEFQGFGYIVVIGNS